ncbi:MAG TPA: hypothetical protein VGV39_04775 [Mesorhizobium sp.]|uniref:hypothetical protein n=1 Tax=Mesorhizobium sp. TaxID=1871066 RepID=UPI002DDCD69E|nr:hypothetical protein [Mesorhizobium sp.]HEV2502363.1 hypothetical protein [Mesorhizobium sp.]
MITTQKRPASNKALVPSSKSTIERMAAAMADMRAAGHTVTADSLAIYGDFTSDQVTRHGTEAANLARSLNVRAVAA